MDDPEKTFTERGTISRHANAFLAVLILLSAGCGGGGPTSPEYVTPEFPRTPDATGSGVEDPYFPMASGNQWQYYVITINDVDFYMVIYIAEKYVAAGHTFYKLVQMMEPGGNSQTKFYFSTLEGVFYTSAGILYFPDYFESNPPCAVLKKPYSAGTEWTNPPDCGFDAWIEAAGLAIDTGAGTFTDCLLAGVDYAEDDDKYQFLYCRGLGIAAYFVNGVNMWELVYYRISDESRGAARTAGETLPFGPPGFKAPVGFKPAGGLPGTPEIFPPRQPPSGNFPRGTY
ncbi:MAG: hypothetical protein AB1742_08440 [bacterium]